MNSTRRLFITTAATIALFHAAPRTHAAPPNYGANVPFKTFEAEAVKGTVTTGTVVKMNYLPAANAAAPELEASRRGYVELDATGEYLEFRKVPKSTGMVIRHCIPDAPGGGGQDATLNVYVNGTYRQTITLSSKHNWLYGVAGDNGQSNDPAAGSPHVFWDDTRFVIQGGLKAGDRIRFQKDASNTAAFYRIDCVDLELIPKPVKPPRAGTFLNVESYGANGSDGNDDAAAIQNCIDAAKAQGKKVWIPAGTYYQSTKFSLNGVTVKGAGMWHTNIIGTAEGTNFAGNVGFSLLGDGDLVCDLFLESDVHVSRSMNGGKFFTGSFNVTDNWRVRNVWMTHGLVGMWISGADRGLVKSCRVYFTYADGINLNRGSSNNRLINNYIRGIGDDGCVVLSEVQNGSVVNPVSTANTIRHNTVIANWWGHNSNIDGGGGHLYELNYLADNSHSACFTINNTSSFPANPLTSAMVRSNMIVRGGSNFASQKRGAIWINAGGATVNNLTFQDNVILDPIYRGIHVVGGQTQNVVFTGNVIKRPGDDAIQIEAAAKGSGSFTNTTVFGLDPGFVAIDNDGGGDYTLTETNTVTK